MKPSTRAQIKMVESVFVVIIFFMLLMIGIVFMSKYQKTESVKTVTEQNMKRAVQLAQTFASLPEVACSTNNVVEENCIDQSKLSAMEELVAVDALYYFDQLKYGTVSVEIFDHELGSWSPHTYLLYNFTKEDSSYSTIPVPMNVYNPILGTYEFGIMNVVFYDN